MQSAYHLKRICGAVYNGGDVTFGAGAGGRETLYSAVGARVIAFDRARGGGGGGERGAP